MATTNTHNDEIVFKPIGFMKSWYKSKNGTVRQGALCPESKGIIELNKTFFDKPSLSIDGLSQFSHLWILFHFHQNTNKKIRSKIRPPRLNGLSTGLFSTRSPHRPNPIGLSLSKMDKIENHCIHLSGIDILDGTPILDIKPYIDEYDNPYKSIESIKFVTNLQNDEKCSNQSKELKDEIFNPTWINLKGVVCEKNQSTESIKVADQILVSNNKSKNESEYNVVFTERSSKQLNLFHSKISVSDHNSEHLIDNTEQLKNLYLNFKKPPEQIEGDERIEKNETQNKLDVLIKCRYCFEFLDSSEEARNAIVNTLAADPRSSYRRQKCSDRLYYFTVDTMHITAWFDQETNAVDVLKIKPNYV